jgi:hypothetical protein
MKTPDITPAQLVAGVPVVANFLHAFGVYDLSQDQQEALRQTLDYALALLGADAIIRAFRNLGIRKAATSRKAAGA